VFGLYCRYPYSLSWIWCGRETGERVCCPGFTSPGCHVGVGVLGVVGRLVGWSVGGCWVLGCWVPLIEVVVEVEVEVEVEVVGGRGAFSFPGMLVYLPTYLPACLRNGGWCGFQDSGSETAAESMGMGWRWWRWR
jgi:hypothetical protein